MNVLKEIAAYALIVAFMFCLTAGARHRWGAGCREDQNLHAHAIAQPRSP